LLAQDRPAGSGVNFYSLEKEAALGRQLAAEAARNSKPLDSAAARDYVNELGQRLAAALAGPDFTYTFTVVAEGADSPTHEPAAYPGGYMFVPAALFLAARDEAEFAGMLAHGIGHIAARHYTRQGTRGEVVAMSAGGWAPQAMNQNQSLAIPLGFIAFQRGNELEADRLAAKAMAGAGFDPAALARYIGRVQPEQGSGPRVFSPLPAREQRVRAIEEVAGGMPARVYGTGDAFAAVREEVRRRVGK
jgi:predicted Zn-dependent protease